MLRGEGGGGNTAVFITTEGVVVVDTKNPGWGQPILEQISKLTSNPVTTLINTHSHADHVSGNVAFSTTVEFVTHETTKPGFPFCLPRMAIYTPESRRAHEIVFVAPSSRSECRHPSPR